MALLDHDLAVAAAPQRTRRTGGPGPRREVAVIRTEARVIVVACGSAKADQARPAAELYTGSLFRAAQRAAQADGGRGSSARPNTG